MWMGIINPKSPENTLKTNKQRPAENQNNSKQKYKLSGVLIFTFSLPGAGDLILCPPSFTPLNISTFDIEETCPRIACIKWNKAYARYGFTCMTKKDRIQRPQCIRCNRVFTNANLKTSNLNEHYNNRPGSVQSVNDFSTLKIKRVWFDSGGTLLKQAFVPMEKQLLLACCKVTFLCGKKRALHSCWRICDTMWTTLVTVTTCLQTRGTREFYERSEGTSA